LGPCRARLMIGPRRGDRGTGPARASRAARAMLRGAELRTCFLVAALRAACCVYAALLAARVIICNTRCFTRARVRPSYDSAATLAPPSILRAGPLHPAAGSWRMREWPARDSRALFAGGGEAEAGLMVLVLNHELPPCTPRLWRAAALRVAADGGANRLYDELPALLPQLSAQQARRAARASAQSPHARTRPAGARAVRAARRAGRPRQRAPGGAGLLRGARRTRHRRLVRPGACLLLPPVLSRSGAQTCVPARRRTRTTCTSA
jgi:hypothetical protein